MGFMKEIKSAEQAMRIAQGAKPYYKDKELSNHLFFKFSKDFDNVLVFFYLKDDFIDTWHSSWEELIESYYLQLNEYDSFRDVEYESFCSWFSYFMKEEDFEILLESHREGAAEGGCKAIDEVNYKNAADVAFSIVRYPRKDYNGDTVFEHLISSLYWEYNAAGLI
jgi:hypothetical protein